MDVKKTASLVNAPIKKAITNAKPQLNKNEDLEDLKKILAESQKEYAHLKSEMGVAKMGAHNTVDPELGVFMARKYFNLKAQVEKLGDQIFSIKQKIERLMPKNDKNIN